MVGPEADQHASGKGEDLLLRHRPHRCTHGKHIAPDEEGGIAFRLEVIAKGGVAEGGAGRKDLWRLSSKANHLPDHVEEFRRESV